MDRRRRQRAFNLFDNMDGAAGTMACVLSGTVAILGAVLGDVWQRRSGQPARDVGLRGGRALHNIALGERISLNDLVAAIGDVLGISLQARHEAPRPGDVLHLMADTTRAREELGFEVVVGFRDGLARTIEHYAEARAPVDAWAFRTSACRRGG